MRARVALGELCRQEVQEPRVHGERRASATRRRGSKRSSSRAGAYVYGSYPDIDSLFKDQAAELDRKKREALLHKIQQLMHEKAMAIPIWELAFINGQGPRVQESGLGLIPGHAYSAPYEDVKLKAK